MKINKTTSTQQQQHNAIKQEENKISKLRMVCSKCQKKLKNTQLATPGVKRKTDIYYGSPSSSFGGGGDAIAGSKAGSKGSSTLGNTGVSKVWMALTTNLFILFEYIWC